MIDIEDNEIAWVSKDVSETILKADKLKDNASDIVKALYDYFILNEWTDLQTGLYFSLLSRCAQNVAHVNFFAFIEQANEDLTVAKRDFVKNLEDEEEMLELMKSIIKKLES